MRTSDMGRDRDRLGKIAEDIVYRIDRKYRRGLPVSNGNGDRHVGLTRIAALKRNHQIAREVAAAGHRPGRGTRSSSFADFLR